MELETLMKKNRSSTISALMFELEVYSGPIFVGTGYQFLTNEGMMVPTLIGHTGEPLPQGWYQLRVMGEGKLVVMPKGIQ